MSCLSTERMRAFLSGGLPLAEEDSAAEHLSGCERCERLAGELSEFSEAATIRSRAVTAALATAERHAAEIGDFCRQLGALRAYEAALEVENGCDGLAHSVGETDPNPVRSGVPGSDQAEAATTEADGMGAAAMPRRLGHYEIVRELGSGTFGVVFLAHDLQLQRPVALKIARTSVLSDRTLKSRFFREAEALARLEHPNIVPVFAAGEIGGECFVALAYCDGPTLHAWLDEHPGPQDPEFAVRLLLPLVDAADHLHSRGVLHRDIKPANILLKSAADAEQPSEPKLADFGLARVLEQPSNETLPGVVLGTACYMAPEQAAGHAERIGPATDVYALGTVLYELLAGDVPIAGTSTIDTLRRLLIDEPAEIRSIAPRVPEDLGAIVHKCLQKSPSQRYASAEELADDLRRFQAGQPTKARPLSPLQRVLRWSGRHKALVPLLTLAACVVGLSLGLFWYADRLSRSQEAWQQALMQLGRAEQAARLRAIVMAEEQYAHDLFAAGKATSKGDIPGAVSVLKRHVPQDGKADLRGLGWYCLWAINTNQPQAFVDAGTQIYQIQLSPDGQTLAAVGGDGSLQWYNARDLTLRGALPTGQVETNGLGLSSSGELAAVAGDDGTVRIFDLATRQEQLQIMAHPDKAYCAVFFDGDRKLATCGKDNDIRLWDAKSGEPLGRLTGHQRQVEAIALSPAGDRLVSAGSDQVAIIWDLATQQPVKSLKRHRDALMAVSFSPDGRWIATGALDNTVVLWNARSGRPADVIPQLDDVQTVGFSADGARLYAGDRGGTVHRYQVQGGKAGDRHIGLRPEPTSPRWQAHAGRVWHTIAGKDGQTFYTAGADQLIRRWDESAPPAAERIIPGEAAEEALALEFSADGRCLFALCRTGGVTVFDAATLEPRARLTCDHSDWRSLRVLGQRHEVAAGNGRGVVAIWNYDRSEPPRIIGSAEGDFPATDLTASANGSRLAVGSLHRDEIRIYNVDSGKLIAALPSRTHTAMAFSPDGRYLAFDWLNDIGLYDLQKGAPIERLSGHSATIRSIAFSADGKRLVSGSNDRTMRLWSIDGEPLATFTGPLADVTEVRISPDSRIVVGLDDRGRAHFAHVPTLLSMFELPLAAQRLRGLAISPDSRRLAVIRELNGGHEIVVLGAASE
jgi:WD40 repeat protein/serine/threonine protein kinase